jgi:hypothetical protein
MIGGSRLMNHSPRIKTGALLGKIALFTPELQICPEPPHRPIRFAMELLPAG